MAGGSGGVTGEGGRAAGERPIIGESRNGEGVWVRLRLCAASLKKNEGGGSFFMLLVATEGTPGSQRATGAKIRYRGRKFATGGEISLL